jgi:hypothetical protein
LLGEYLAKINIGELDNFVFEGVNIGVEYRLFEAKNLYARYLFGLLANVNALVYICEWYISQN